MKNVLGSALLATGLLFSADKVSGSSLENSFAKDTTKSEINLKSEIPELNFRYSEILGSSLADVNLNGKVDGKFIIYKIKDSDKGVISAYYPLEGQENEELFFSENPLFILDKNTQNSYDAYISKNGKGLLYNKTSYEELSKWLQNSYDPCVEVEF